MASAKAKKVKFESYQQKFRSEWLLDEKFKIWLDRTSTNEAYCKWCKITLQPKLSVIKLHGESKRHKNFESSCSGSSKVSNYFGKERSLRNETRRAELMITAFLVDHNIPFRVLDHLSDVLSKAFPDSLIARDFACKRTKSACLAYNILGQELKTELINDIAKAKHFSVIIDESTDRSTTKSLAVVIKYYSTKQENVVTRLLNLVPVLKGRAEDLFAVLRNEIEKHKLSLTDLIGFSADTTNVMFGCSNSIVSRIKDVSPSCIVVKCVCHSTALSVSHASKTLPRNIEQLVRDIYNYFSQSAKRMDEFTEFQDFTDTPKHRIMKCYDIRWLSLRACVSRILEQWSPLSLFFQRQYLIDRIQVSEKMAVELGCIFNKFYFTVLDYVLYITDKLNTVFQSDNPTIHSVYANCMSGYKSVISCFMKKQYLRYTDEEIWQLDPSEASFHVDLKQMYLGINAAKIMTEPAFTNRPPAAQLEVLQRCKNFLVVLAEELQKRLPINQLMKDLEILNPRVAISGDIPTLAPLLTKLPNIIPPKLHQDLDAQWRQLPLTGSNGDVFSTTEFWVNVGKIEEFSLISTLATKLLSLPVSNVACERIFSKVNFLKTNQRNRFTVPGIAAHIFAEEGLHDSNNKNCTNFQPTKEMIDNMNKDIYQNVHEILGVSGGEDDVVKQLNEEDLTVIS